MKGKATFTKSEAKTIVSLIKQKVLADATMQKKTRNKIRAIGFYASEFGIGNGYTVEDFLRVTKINGSKPQRSTLVSAPTKKTISGTIAIKSTTKRENSDEAYIIGLCDAVLKAKGICQHRFEFLVGDSGTKLPVDVYYPELNLVIEYRERQHTEDVKFFNRRKTVSGVNRGEQRKIYDQRRRDVLPKHGVKLIELSFDEFEHDIRKRLKRNKGNDLGVLRKKLKNI